MNMSGEVEVPKTPEWLKTLEEKREKRLKARLGHEAGAGAPCLKCEDKCPGLDLHFWRKNCKICRCSKEDHDAHDDDIYSWAEFELLGSRPNKIKTKIVLPGKKDEVELEWAPKGQKDTVDKYLKTLPPEKIPVKGSQAAQERKQALQKQIPIHDIDPALCHELNDDEIEKMKEYIAHVKKSSVGVGQIVNLSNVIKANLHNINPQEAHIIASRYAKGVPFTEIVKLQAGLAKNLEKLAIGDAKNKGLPHMQPQPGFGGTESIQNPTIASKMRDLSYQNLTNFDPNINSLNPQYAGSLYPNRAGNITNEHIPFDSNIDEKLMQGTNFDPSKTPSQFKGYHTPGYKPFGTQKSLGDSLNNGQRYFDDVNNLLQNTDKISGALSQDKVPYNLASSELLRNTPGLYSGPIPGRQENITGLPYNHVREGFKPCGVEHGVNAMPPNYFQNLSNCNQLNQNDPLSLPYQQLKVGFKPGEVEYQQSAINEPIYSNLVDKSKHYHESAPNSVAEHIKNLPLKPCNIEHQLNPNIPYNIVSDPSKKAYSNIEVNPSQLPLYAQNLAAKAQSNEPVDSQNYGFENPMFQDNPSGLPHGKPNEHHNTMTPKNMKDLMYSTYDPSDPKTPEESKIFGKIDNQCNDPNSPEFANINTQHGSLGYIPGSNVDPILIGGSTKHPLLDKYGNVESNPAYTGELGSPQTNSGKSKVSGLKNLFESNKNTGENQDRPSNFPSNPSAFYDPRIPSHPPIPRSQNYNTNVSEIDPRNPDGQNSLKRNPNSAFYDPRGQRPVVPSQSYEGGDSNNPRNPIGQNYLGRNPNSAFYDPRGQTQGIDLTNPDVYGDPKNQNYGGSHPNIPINSAEQGNPNSAFYDPREQTQRVDSTNPSLYGDPKNQNYGESNPNILRNPAEKSNPNSDFYDPRGQREGVDPSNPITQGSHPNQLRKGLPHMQPGSLNISEEYVNPNQVNIGAIRDINYPDNEIKEAMVASNHGEDFYGEDYSPDSIKEILNNIVLPNCHYCKKPFEENEFAVTIERANVLFHAGCFKCAGCNQSLADNIYFYHNESNNVYCGRDYAKIKGYPRCNACDELIFTKEYCLAENATFHLKHFCCFQCDTPLAGKEYTLEDEQPYCLPCFEITKASKCSTCQNVIKPDETGCSLNGVHFHAEDGCFACIVCKKPLLGQKLLLRNEKLYCSHDCFNSIN